MHTAKVDVALGPLVDGPTSAESLDRRSWKPRLDLDLGSVPVQARPLDRLADPEIEIDDVADHMEEGGPDPLAPSAPEHQSHPVRPDATSLRMPV